MCLLWRLLLLLELRNDLRVEADPEEEEQEEQQQQEGKSFS